MAKRKVQASAKSRGVRAPRIISSRFAEVGERLRQRAAETYTIAQAFDFFCAPGDIETMENLNFEGAIRAVGFLLHWCTQTGNKPLEGPAASGLGHILDDLAEQFRYVQAGYERQLDALRDDLRREAERPEGRK